MADRKDYIPQRELDKLIISQYREGRPAKSIARDLKHYTIDHEGGGVAPWVCGAGYLRGRDG